MINSKSLKSNTGYKGVYFRKDKGNFSAEITIYSLTNIKHNIMVGHYNTLKEAVKAREDFIKSLF
jgi:hypothetical protein